MIAELVTGVAIVYAAFAGHQARVKRLADQGKLTGTQAVKAGWKKGRARGDELSAKWKAARTQAKVTEVAAPRPSETVRRKAAVVPGTPTPGLAHARMTTQAKNNETGGKGS